MLTLNLNTTALPFSQSTHHFFTNTRLPNSPSSPLLLNIPTKPSKPTSHILCFNSTHFSFSSNPKSQTLIPKASSSSSFSDADSIAPKPNSTTRQLALIFGLWYLYNIVFNIYNKKVLNIFPYPWLLASFQLLTGSLWMLILWSLNLQPRPKISKPFILALLLPALFHTIGHISACVSFSKVAVSFTHVIKSSEPVFSVVFSSLLGDAFYPLSVWLSILPIVMGCSLAAVTEVSFNLQGLSSAMWGSC